MRYLSNILVGAVAAIATSAFASPPIVNDAAKDAVDQSEFRTFSEYGILTCEMRNQGPAYDLIFIRQADQKRFLIEPNDALFDIVCADQQNLVVAIDGRYTFSTVIGLNRIEAEDFEIMRTLDADESLDLRERGAGQWNLPSESFRFDQ